MQRHLNHSWNIWCSRRLIAGLYIWHLCGSRSVVHARFYLPVGYKTSCTEAGMFSMKLKKAHLHLLWCKIWWSCLKFDREYAPLRINEICSQLSGTIFLAVRLADLHMLKCKVYVVKSATWICYPIQLPETETPESHAKYFMFIWNISYKLDMNTLIRILFTHDIHTPWCLFYI